MHAKAACLNWSKAVLMFCAATELLQKHITRLLPVVGMDPDQGSGF